MYCTGHGRITIRAKCHLEVISNSIKGTSRSKNAIVITELPYMTNKAGTFLTLMKYICFIFIVILHKFKFHYLLWIILATISQLYSKPRNFIFHKILHRIVIFRVFVPSACFLFFHFLFFFSSFFTTTLLCSVSLAQPCFTLFKSKFHLLSCLFL